jgi:hypothetical protein
LNIYEAALLARYINRQGVSEEYRLKGPACRMFDGTFWQDIIALFKIVNFLLSFLYFWSDLVEIKNKNRNLPCLC